MLEGSDGHQVVGEVVLEKSNAIYVDLGFDVIKIPRDQIISRKKSGQTVVVAVAPAPAASADIDPTGFNIRKQSLQRRTFQCPAGEAAIVVPVGDQ